MLRSQLQTQAGHSYRPPDGAAQQRAALHYAPPGNSAGQQGKR